VIEQLDHGGLRAAIRLIPASPPAKELTHATVVEVSSLEVAALQPLPELRQHENLRVYGRLRVASLTEGLYEAIDVLPERSGAQDASRLGPNK
jgi:hypothetical protein